MKLPSMSPTMRYELPGLDADMIPGEHFVERSARAIVILFAIAIGAGVGTAFLISVNTTIRANGILQPQAVWTVRPQESGIVAHVSVQTGHRVQAGDVLLQIDTTALAAIVRDLESRLTSAKLEVVQSVELRPIDLLVAEQREESAIAALVRSRVRLVTTLIDYGRVPDVDSAKRKPAVGSVQVAVDAARADVRQAEADLHIARLSIRRLATDTLNSTRGELARQQIASELEHMRSRLRWHKVKAPSDGIVLTDRPDLLRGRFVREGEEVLELGSPTGWVAELLVTESDVRRVRPGQPVELELNSVNRVRPSLLKGEVLTVAAEPWRPLMDPSGSLGTAMSSPRYRVVCRIVVFQSVAQSEARRGFTVRARIHTGRERAIRVLVDRLFGQPGA